MPDTFTHIALPVVFSRLIKEPLHIPMLLIGTVLPDYFREFFKLILPAKYSFAVIPFHSFIGIILTSLLLASLFSQSQRKHVFLSLLLGQIVHLSFDVCQFYLCANQFHLLFPYMHNFQFALVSESDWIYIFIFSASIFLLYIFFTFLSKHQQIKS